MIFLSHNFNDKAIVEPIATRLKQVYGENKVFYDSWSIKPGDNIIDRMNTGIENAEYFFYFISQNSLKSKMVDLEWQSALYKKVKQNIKFIPVKIDNSIPPAILLSTLYIDIYTYGFENGIRQMFDVINNINTQNTINEFSNLQVMLIKNSISDYEIVIEAKYFFEPNTRFWLVYKNNNEDISFEMPTESTFIGGEINKMQLSNGLVVNGRAFQLMRSLEPGFPVRVHVKEKNNNLIDSLLMMKQVSETEAKSLPTIEKVGGNR